jgi:hypothetical protein
MALRPTSVYIDGDIKLLYMFHFSLFLYYAISFLIIYYLIIIKVIVWLRSKLLSLADCLHFSPGHNMFIYRHVITNKFTLWWSDKLKQESTYLNIVLFTLYWKTLNIVYTKYCCIWPLENRHDVHSEIYQNLFHNIITLKRPPFSFFYISLLHISQ